MSIPPGPLRVVLDTNVWISGLFFGRGVPARLLREWRGGRFEVVLTSDTLDEITRILRRKAIQFGAPPELASGWHDFIETYAVHITVETRLSGLSRDPNDDMLLEAAVAGRAHYLVSGDKDLLVLERIETVPIITRESFWVYCRPGTNGLYPGRIR